jgi:glutamate dehydrogenase
MRTDTSEPSEALPTDPEPLIKELAHEFRETAESVVPWFLRSMPRMYFQDTDLQAQLSHLRSIIALRASGVPLEITMRSEDGRLWTAMRPTNYPGVLAEIMAELPLDQSLRSAKIHTAADGSFVLDTFEFGEQDPFDLSDPEQCSKIEATIEYVRAQGIDWKEEDIRAYCSQCTADYIRTLTPLRMEKHRELFEMVSGTDSSVVTLEPEADPNHSRVTIAIANARTRTTMERAANLIASYGVDIHRAYLDVVGDAPHGSVTYVGFILEAPGGGALDESSELWKSIQRELRRIKWIDFNVLGLSQRHEDFHIDRAELLLALCHLAHQVLSPRNAFAFTRDRILSRAEDSMDISRAILKLFTGRFNPKNPTPEEAFLTQADELRARIEREVDTETGRETFFELVNAVVATLRTNYFLPSRFGLALRLDPTLLLNERRPELPYGVFYVHGRGFSGFHVRFQDIARGGLRVVKPRSMLHHLRESERLYDEVYGLSFAQHLKNKDIPEGGAKATILIEPEAGIDRCVKSFIDSLLDLITPNEDTRRLLIDRFEHDELIYLGPDENITPRHIQWMVRRAGLRDYPMPNAFMSSKPGAGINHKVYGVTSEGVNVFLAEFLGAQGLDPKTMPFSVKITGGPDGDVAGNMIKILDRDYGRNVSIVGIADGSGCGEDPDGLDFDELLRLVREELPIASFDKSRLGPRGRVVDLDDPDGFRLRNTMHNRVIADAFLPCGGRPATMHEYNWREFLTEDGTPTSRLIVEGANLFLTPGARERLSAEGVTIVKDSSANKCGVICSSFEVAASMLLDEKEFMEIKSEFVEQVLEKLRELARLEALLLIHEQQRHPLVPLPELSVRLSRTVNSVADAIQSRLQSESEEALEFAWSLVLEHLPQILVTTAGERLHTGLPRAYLSRLMSSRLAAEIVYREGTAFFASMEPETIAETACRYLAKDLETKRLVDLVRGSSLEEADRVAELLRRAGTRASLQDP